MTDKNNTKTVRVKDKIKAIYPHIVVGGKIDKPCFSIHWYDVKKKEMYIGYSSYNLNYVREWLKENFEIVEPEIDNLLKRQKTEIERLKSMNQAKLDCIHDLQSENEELTNEVDSLKKQMEWLTGYNQNLMSANTALSEEIFIAKAEAYKEFAEKAKENFQNLEYSADTDRKTVKVEEMKEQINWVLHSVAAETLDNILEELVGENNERNIV